MPIKQQPQTETCKYFIPQSALQLNYLSCLKDMHRKTDPSLKTHNQPIPQLLTLHNTGD